MNTVKVLVAFTALAVTLQLEFAAGTNYTVGAPGGLWDLQTDYTKWVSNITFYPGDNLIFSYSATHDIWEVMENDYKTCTSGSPIKQYSGGNNVIALTKPESRFFYCSISNHCSRGMKLQVSVIPNNPSSPPSPLPSPPSPLRSPPPSPPTLPSSPPSPPPSPPSLPSSPPSPPPSPPSLPLSPPTSPSPPSPPSPSLSPPSSPPPPNDAAALNGIGTRLAIALVLGEMLMFFV